MYFDSSKILKEPIGRLNMIHHNLRQLFGLQPEKAIQTRIKIKIPQTYHTEPIISQLAVNFKLQVNLIAAILGKDGDGDGWFELQLQGYQQQIDRAINYLTRLDIDIWQVSEDIDRL
jgi:ABC-type methionine transport system ATPase subunit